MSTTEVRSRAQALAEAVRVRIRLRTRLRRVRDAWRSRFPRPLPAWPDRRDEPSAAVPRVTVPPATSVVQGTVALAPGAASPRGRQSYGGRQPAGRLSLYEAAAGDPSWQIARTSDGVTVVAGRVGEPLDERQQAVLSQLGAVTADLPAAGTMAGTTAGAVAGPPAGLSAGSPTAWAQLLAQLAVTGVVLHAPPGELLAQAPGGLLAPELAALIAEPLPARNADPLEWEVRGVRQRRAAMRGHAAGLAEPPTVSALLVTKRPQLVAAAVATLARQTYPRLEIVVGVHGAPAPSDLDAAGRPVRVVPIPAELCLGEALSEAAAAASGELLTKVDDDDHYGAEHIWDLVLARHYSQATVVGKGAEFVYLEPKDITVRRRMGAEFFTDTVAGGTIALSRDDLAAVGGWPPVPRWVDRALLDRVLAGGGQVYRTHPIGFVYTRHGDGHTWDADLAYFLRDPLRKWRGLPPHDEFGDAREPDQDRSDGAGEPARDRRGGDGR